MKLLLIGRTLRKFWCFFRLREMREKTNSLSIFLINQGKPNFQYFFYRLERSKFVRDPKFPIGLCNIVRGFPFQNADPTSTRWVNFCRVHICFISAENIHFWRMLNIDYLKLPCGIAVFHHSKIEAQLKRCRGIN